MFFSLRATAPAAVSILTLYVLAELTGTASTDYFSAVTIIVTMLSITLLQSSRTPAAELITPRRVVAFEFVGALVGVAAGLAGDRLYRGLSARVFAAGDFAVGGGHARATDSQSAGDR